jgi:hydrogenase/urease accessory protein HupE
VVEPLIAASVVYVGLENIFRQEPSRRWLLGFGFGLVHGLGFASALREMGVGEGGGGLAVALLSFNLGVEIAQVSIALVVLPAIAKLRALPAARARWVPASSALLALAGAWWLIERSLLA